MPVKLHNPYTIIGVLARTAGQGHPVRCMPPHAWDAAVRIDGARLSVFFKSGPPDK
jgi:hypothetical protein